MAGSTQGFTWDFRSFWKQQPLDRSSAGKIEIPTSKIPISPTSKIEEKYACFIPSCGPDFILAGSNDSEAKFNSMCKPYQTCYQCIVKPELKAKAVCPEGWNYHPGGDETGPVWALSSFVCSSECAGKCDKMHPSSCDSSAPLPEYYKCLDGIDAARAQCKSASCPTVATITKLCPEGFIYENLGSYGFSSTYSIVCKLPSSASFQSTSSEKMICSNTCSHFGGAAFSLDGSFSCILGAL